MARPLPPLRRGLDLMPSPVEDRPGLLIRDPFRYSDAVLIIPPPLVPLLAQFDGEHTELDLRHAVVRLSGDDEVGDVMQHFVGTLSSAGFLDDEVSVRMRETREAAFAAAPRRVAAHAGSAYPDEIVPLRETMGRYLDGASGEEPTSVRPGLVGIAAPHVSPEGGWRSYRAAYGALGPELTERTFVVLGTSHYGEPERFGVTRKPYATPLGETAVDAELVEHLAAAGPAVRLEDYCHAVEHSIEFQVVFLQHLYGPSVRVVPVLCGPFARSTLGDGLPEDDAGVGRFIEVLAEVAAARDRVFWVLGIDMTHMGRRYGDAFRARANFGKMAAVATRDRQRLERIAAGDAAGFWELLREGGDALRWCGASSLYAFLRAAAPARGELLRYEQWNIDDASVVTFAGLAFS
jgi:hypothetical protein